LLDVVDPIDVLASNYVLNSQPAVFLDPANVEVIYEYFPS